MIYIIHIDIDNYKNEDGYQIEMVVMKTFH